MKKISTLLTMLVLLFCGAVVAQAQSKIPGELDLSTSTVDAGTGTLHGSAGWDGSKIDWMTKGNTATIQFENTKADTKYSIISYGGTNQAQVVVNFCITAADGSVFYDATTEPYAVGGFGDKKANKSLPVTNPMPAGNYTLVMTYDNLEEGQSLTVNISKVEFLDSEALPDDPSTNKLGLNIPGVLDGSKATIEKNCSWGSTPSCDDNNCFNWVGDGDIISFPITNTKTSAYAIAFDTATPCEPVTIDFLITDANGQTVYGQTANVVCTGVDGGDWAFKPEGHNTSLPNTDVLPAGNYTLKLTFHQGTNYENFTTNVKDITFTEAGGSGDSFDIDLSTVDTSDSQGNKTLHYMGEGDENCPRLDYPSAGDVAKFAINITKEAAYQMSINYATPMDGMFMTWIITDASGKEVYNQMFNLDPTGAPGDFWTIYKDFDNIPQTPVLPVGAYTLIMKYNIDQNGNIVPGSYNGDENGNFHVNIKRITFTAVAGETPVEANFVRLSGNNLNVDASTPDLYQFDNAEGFTITMNARALDKQKTTWTDPDGVILTDYINIKNNDPVVINVPEGKKIYALAIGGSAQSADRNMNYIYKIDVDDANFFTDAIGSGVKEDAIISSSATYPIKVDGNGPRFALLDFTAAPATKSVSVTCSGNVQQDSWFQIYITEADANAVLGKATPDTPSEGVIFSWEGSEGGAIEKGGKATFEGGDEGENRVNYANTTAAGTTFYTLSLNGNKANINDEGYEKNKTPRIVITLDQALEANDEIAVTAYTNKGDDTKISTPYFLFANGTELLDDDKTFIDLGYDTNTEPSTQTYTVPEAAAGSTSFKITRSKTGTNLFITKLVITRGATGIQTIETVSVRKQSNAVYNLAGQKVGANYKGIVIKNGRKYLQK
ncbi:MAG: hypothetical protein IKI26_11660 [Prevotella sp.]|nr:hypothetical protein [Prevotella sp.]